MVDHEYEDLSRAQSSLVFNRSTRSRILVVESVEHLGSWCVMMVSASHVCVTSPLGFVAAAGSRRRVVEIVAALRVSLHRRLVRAPHRAPLPRGVGGVVGGRIKD